MAALNTDARLFGLDLNGLAAQWLQAMRAMGHWPVCRWLKPKVVVRAIMPHGEARSFLWSKKPLSLCDQHTGASSFDSLVLPEDVVLRHRFTLPPLPPSEAQAALALAVQSLSPFPPEHTLWAAHPATADGTAHDVVLTSRPLVQAHVDAMRPHIQSQDARAQPEVWAESPHAAPFVLPGFGEARRERRLRRGFRLNVALCVIALGLALGAAVTPTLQLRLRALDAQAQYANLQQAVAPALALRESHTKAEEQLQALAEVAGQPVSAIQVLDLVTRALPDDASLLSFALNATESPAKPAKVVLTGNAVNAAALMQKLGTQPGLRDIRALAPATKPLGADKESFTIEVTLDLAGVKP